MCPILRGLYQSVIEMASKLGLTEKQKRFVAEYLVDLNATQAAIRAGYSEKTANEQGCRLLANVSVAAAVAKGAQKRIVKAEISAQDVLEGLHREATREDEGSSHSARVSAWVALGKYHNLFVERLDLKATISLEDLVRQSLITAREQK